MSSYSHLVLELQTPTPGQFGVVQFVVRLYFVQRLFKIVWRGGEDNWLLLYSSLINSLSRFYTTDQVDTNMDSSGQLQIWSVSLVNDHW